MKLEAVALVEGFEFETLIADKGYDYNDFIEILSCQERRLPRAVVDQPPRAAHHGLASLPRTAFD